MCKNIDNSLFHQDLKDLKVLLIVPHEDDEINTAGALTDILTSCGATMKLVYTTNGDWKYPASTRMKEAIEAASVLGIRSKDIIFLGYGDSINNNDRNHLFYADKVYTKSQAGYSETYGTELFSDYSYTINGCHHEYIRQNYLDDIISVLRNERPDMIICTDFDEHPDHRMLSLYLDKAIGILRSENREYCPEVWKRFAYALAYTAVSDYTPVNNPETKRPSAGVTDKYKWDIIDTSYYAWEERIRIPASNNEGKSIRNNLIARALLKHKSQYIITHADRIINSDEVFWKRRTDSLSSSARVRTSSGNGDYLNDFMLYNVRDVDALVPEFCDYYWKPDEDDKEKEVRLDWDDPQHIEEIVLYGSIDAGSRIDKLELRLSDGFLMTVTNLPNNGNPLKLCIGEHENISSCDIKILSASGDNFGISECEVYGKSKNTCWIKPFCKILINDNFVYNYICGLDIKKLRLASYGFNCESSLNFSVVSGNSTIMDEILIIDEKDRDIIIRLENEDSTVWDQIVIKRLSNQEMQHELKREAADKNYLKTQRYKYKIHNMLYILQHQGIRTVLKRTYENVIRPHLLRR